jgi:hypothetical protein
MISILILFTCLLHPVTFHASPPLQRDKPAHCVKPARSSQLIIISCLPAFPAFSLPHPDAEKKESFGIFRPGSMLLLGCRMTGLDTATLPINTSLSYLNLKHNFW